MREIFSLTYPLTPGEDASFSVTESEDGAIGVSTNGMWIRIPFQAYQQLHDVLRDQQQQQAGGDPCTANATTSSVLCNHVRRLVIAAREAWEDATDSEKLQALDKALEPFSEAVPYANEPDRCAVSSLHINPDHWHCGNGKLRQQFAMAMMVAKGAPMSELDDLEYLADQCGPQFTRSAIRRLMPQVPVQELMDSEIPF